MAPTEDYDDDRRVHRRERRREGTHEDVELARHEVQLRGGLSNSSRLPNVPTEEGQRTSPEESVQKFRAAHELAV